jgi:hypothetical protein
MHGKPTMSGGFNKKDGMHKKKSSKDKNPRGKW